MVNRTKTDLLGHFAEVGEQLSHVDGSEAGVFCASDGDDGTSPPVTPPWERRGRKEGPEGRAGGEDRGMRERGQEEWREEMGRGRGEKSKEEG